MASKENNTQFAVIGLGRFGKALTEKLCSMGKEVLVIDDSEERINAISDIATHSIVADATEEEVLKSVGIWNFDVVCVCIGENMQASILTTLICKELGAKMILAKAQSAKHEAVLKKIGADIVIFPDDYMGRKIGSMIVNSNYTDVTELSNKFKMVEIKVPDAWIGKSLVALELRKHYGISVILIKRQNDTDSLAPTPESIFDKNDTVIIAGSIDEINKLVNKEL